MAQSKRPYYLKRMPRHFYMPGNAAIPGLSGLLCILKGLTVNRKTLELKRKSGAISPDLYNLILKEIERQKTDPLEEFLNRLETGFTYLNQSNN